MLLLSRSDGLWHAATFIQRFFATFCVTERILSHVWNFVPKYLKVFTLFLFLFIFLKCLNYLLSIQLTDVSPGQSNYCSGLKADVWEHRILDNLTLCKCTMITNKSVLLKIKHSIVIITEAERFWITAATKPMWHVHPPQMYDWDTTTIYDCRYANDTRSHMLL